MKGRHKLVGGVIVVVVTSLIVSLMLFVRQPVVLAPQGPVGIEQRNLLLLATGIMLLVALPVLIMAFVIAHTYRASNKKARYTPTVDRGRLLELTWWGIPIVIVTLLSVVAWQTSHTLDPFRPLAGSQPYQVQVVALQWKWLFIYPEYQTASVGELAVPVGRPVAFSIAADAPMNSFWIPELGGQIYAMDGMNTQLHLQADRAGTFRGVSSNLSGAGFADMKFTVRAMDDGQLASWHYDATVSDHHLSLTTYDELAKPTTLDAPIIYRLDDDQLYQTIIDKYALSHSQAADSGGHHYEEGGMH